MPHTPRRCVRPKNYARSGLGECLLMLPQQLASSQCPVATLDLDAPCVGASVTSVISSINMQPLTSKEAWAQNRKPSFNPHPEMCMDHAEPCVYAVLYGGRRDELKAHSQG